MKVSLTASEQMGQITGLGLGLFAPCRDARSKHFMIVVPKAVYLNHCHQSPRTDLKAPVLRL